MSAAGGVTADELVKALKKRRATLPAEIGTFVALESCEAMLARGPAAVTLRNLRISDEGVVRIEEASAVDEEDGARALHAALTSLLVAAGPAPTPALMRLVEEGPTGGAWTLGQMRDDLEASLVPLNRNASRRVLARLVRETGWNERPSANRGPTFRELDAELSSLLGVEAPPGPEPEPTTLAAEPLPGRARRGDDTEHDFVEDVDPADEELDEFDEPTKKKAPPLKQGTAPGFFDDSASASAGVAPRSAVSSSDKTLLDSAPVMSGSSPSASASWSAPAAEPWAGSASPPGSLRSLESLDSMRPRSSSRGVLVGVGLVVLALGLLGVTLLLRPDAISRLSGAKASEQTEPKEPRVVHKPAVGGDLLIHVTPERAQVLRFVGRGPATVPHLPVGVAHEFVAIGDGARPTRALIPPDGEWEPLPEGPRFELAMQLGEAPSNAPATLDLGDTLLPQNVGRPTGALGSARVVTTPRGAKVYQLIGFAPDVKVEDVALDKTEELLIYLPGHAHVVRVIAPSDFVQEGERKVARVDIALKRR
jgi:hypothetical protein